MLISVKVVLEADTTPTKAFPTRRSLLILTNPWIARPLLSSSLSPSLSPLSQQDRFSSLSGPFFSLSFFVNSRSLIPLWRKGVSPMSVRARRLSILRMASGIPFRGCTYLSRWSTSKFLTYFAKEGSELRRYSAGWRRPSLTGPPLRRSGHWYTISR